MFRLTKAVINIQGKRFSFNHDGYGYYVSRQDERKYRSGLNSFTYLVNDKRITVEEYKLKDGIWRIGHIELRNFANTASVATVYYMQGGKEKRRSLKDPSDIEIVIEDGIYMEDE